MAQDITETAMQTLIQDPTANPDAVTPLSSRALFWRPLFRPHSPALRHVPFLFWLVDTLRPAAFATLGGGDGVAHFALCQAVDKLGLDSRGYGYGPWAGPGLPDWIVAHNTAAHGELSYLSAQDARTGAAGFPRGRLDLVLAHFGAGGDAAGTGVSDDLSLAEALERDWLPRLSDRGVLLVMGSGLFAAGGAATALTGRLAESGPTFSFEGREGMLLALLGREPPRALVQLCGLTIGRPGYGSVLQVFGRLGGALETEAALEVQTRRAEALAAELALVGTSAPGPLDESGDPPTGSEQGGHQSETEALAEAEALAAALAETEARHAEALAAALAEAGVRHAEALAEAEARHAEALAAALAETEARHAEALAEAGAQAEVQQAEALAAVATRHAAAMAEAAAAAALRQDDILRQVRILAAERDAIEAELIAARSRPFATEPASARNPLADQDPAHPLAARLAAAEAAAADQAAAFAADLQQLTLHIETLRAEADAERALLRAECDAARAEVEAARAAREELAARLGTTADQTETSAAALAAARAAVETAQAAADRAEAERALVEDELAGLRMLLQERLARIETLTAAAAEDSRMIATLRAERAAAQAEMRAVQDTVEQILSSTSWRMTGPLRRMIQTLRSGPRQGE